MKLVIFFAAVWGAGLWASGQSPDLVALKFQYDAAITTVHSTRIEEQQSLSEQYTNALNVLRLKAQTGGDLDKVRIVLAELARFQNEKTPPTVPLAAADLQNMAAALAKHGRDIDQRAAADLLKRTESYDAALTALQTALTKNGKIEEAVNVQEERKALPTSTSVVEARAILGMQAPTSTPVVVAGTAAPPPSYAVAPWIVPQLPPPNAAGWVAVFDGQRLYGCNLGTSVVANGQIKVEKGLLRIQNTRVVFGVSARDVAVRVRAKKIGGQNMAILLRHGPPNINYLAWFNGERSFGIGKNTSERFVDIKKGSSSEAFDDFLEMEMSAEGDKLTLKVGGKTVVSASDEDIRESGNLGFSAHKGECAVRSIEYKLLSGRK